MRRRLSSAWGWVLAIGLGAGVLPLKNESLWTVGALPAYGVPCAECAPVGPSRPVGDACVCVDDVRAVCADGRCATSPQWCRCSIPQEGGWVRAGGPCPSPTQRCPYSPLPASLSEFQPQGESVCRREGWVIFSHALDPRGRPVDLRVEGASDPDFARAQVPTLIDQLVEEASDPGFARIQVPTGSRVVNVAFCPPQNVGAMPRIELSWHSPHFPLPFSRPISEPIMILMRLELDPCADFTATTANILYSQDPSLNQAWVDFLNRNLQIRLLEPLNARRAVLLLAFTVWPDVRPPEKNFVTAFMGYRK